MSYKIYFILAVIFFVGELFTMEFSLTCLGIGLLAAGAAAWLGLGIWGQVFIFAAVASLCWLGIRPIALRHFYTGAKNVKTPAEDVIGQEAVVEIAIDPVKQGYDEYELKLGAVQTIMSSTGASIGAARSASWKN